MSMHSMFRQTEAKLVVAVNKWSHHLGYPGGLGSCGRCRYATQWGVCPYCQPDAFAMLP